MNLVSFFDLTALFFSFISIGIIIRKRKSEKLHGLKWPLFCLFIFILLYNLFLFGEWSGITKNFNAFEDLVGSMIPMWWIFIFYMFLHQIDKSDLKKSENRYYELVQNLPVGIWRTTLGGKGQYLMVNPSLAEMFGCGTSKELLEMNASNFYKDPLQRRLLSDLLIEKGSVKGKELELIKLDGTPIVGLVTAHIIKDELGTPLYIDGMVLDITKRKHAEKELKEYAQRLSIHVEQTPLGVIEWDLNFKVTQWNNAAKNIFGYSKEEAIGQTGLELVVPKEAQDLVKTIWDDLVSGNGGTRSTNENVTKDGKLIVCEWYNTVLSDNKGVVIGVASLIQDITDQKKFEKDRDTLEQQLQQSQKMEAIGTLAGGIAHDFNNILGIILGYSEMLKTDLSLDAASDENLNAIINAGNRAKDLVNQILAFSRQNEKEFIPIRPDIIIKETFKMLRASIPTTIEIRMHILKSGSITGDPTQFHQIVMNLCTNAYHSMRDQGGVLEIILESIILGKNDVKILSSKLSPGAYLKLEISDTGHGINDETLHKIFTPYFTTKKKGEGTGLGLSVVHGIVKSFGGHISVYSELNKGTTFRVYFPQIGLETKNSLLKTIEPIPTGHERILIVDDEETIVQMEKQMLEGLGYQVSACKSSLEALKTFQNQPGYFSLIITDMTMPDMTGLELIQNVQHIQPDIPVILCSGFSELINEKKAELMGIQKYLQKPILKRDLAVAIRDLLDGDKN